MPSRTQLEAGLTVILPASADKRERDTHTYKYTLSYRTQFYQNKSRVRARRSFAYGVRVFKKTCSAASGLA